jgi:hypothetical protein
MSALPRRPAPTPPGMRRPPRWRLVAWGVPAWGAFVALWYLALSRQPGALAIGLAVGLAGMVLSAGIVFTWVAHNRRQARRREGARGGRRGAPAARVLVTHDARGREVRIAPGAHDARVLSVMVEGDAKVIGPPGAA